MFAKRYRSTRPLAGLVLVLLWGLCVSSALGQPLNPTTLTKYLDPLPIPPVMQPTTPGGTYYEVGTYPIHQQLHSQLPPTYLWGYGTSQETAAYPGATFVVTRGTPIQVRWTNNLVDEFGNPLPHPLPVDQTLHWADPLHQHPSFERYTGPVPTTVHVHGSEVEPESDGGPDSWFTPGFGITGPGWMHEVYEYANTQPASTLFYHDHALGITRQNVYMGLAGGYVVLDPAHEPPNLPSGEFDIPLILQDRLFDVGGQLDYPQVGINPEHPFWVPEVFGNTMLVNGKIWPYLDVQPRKYRFRLVNGSSARFYSLSLVDQLGNPGPAFVQISTDGGYLASSVLLNNPADPNAPRLLLAPGERADIIVDFAGLPPGTRFVLNNNAKSPYPNGAPTDPQTTRQIMQIRVVAGTADNLVIPSVLNTIPSLGPGTVIRTLTLNEVMGMGGPLAMFLDGKMWDAEVSELPVVGSTELWQIVNLTADTHPIHLHLVQFQLVSRQGLRVSQYQAEYDRLNPVIPAEVTFNPPIGRYLRGQPRPPDPNERGWKDTIRMNPGEVSSILVRFAPYGEQGVTPYAFDATAEPGYVWHCHIIDHEDNEMMRPYKLVASPGGLAQLAFPLGSELTGKPDQKDGLRFRLEQNAPNPFRPSTEIRFTLPAAGAVNLRVFDVQGRVVRTLASGEMPAGEHAVLWDGNDADGRKLPAGVYSYRLQAADRVVTRRMILIE